MQSCSSLIQASETGMGEECAILAASRLQMDWACGVAHGKAWLAVCVQVNLNSHLLG